MRKRIYSKVKVKSSEKSIGGSQIDNWSLTNGNESKPATDTFTFRKIDNVSIQNGEIFSLNAIRDDKDKGYIDYVEFVPIIEETPAVIDSPPDALDVDVPREDLNVTSGVTLGVNSDILRGGAGNDGIDGGAGNDIIFGEDELNDSSNITSFWIDGAFHYGYSTYILTSPDITWEEAQAEAQSYGGNLVTINDAAEETWLRSTFGTDDYFWIGLLENNIQGQFRWIDGEALTYTHFDPKNNDDPSKYYFVLNEISTTGEWAEKAVDEIYQGIIEIDWSSVGGNDTIFGGAGDDQVYGNSGNDVIYGDSGNDKIFGNGGHDIIRGGAGDDEINGTDTIVAGYLEKDTLEGGAGADKFILGDETQAFYATEGAQDYAVIEDFNAGKDIVQFYGEAGDYQQTQQGNDLHLTRNGDLVAILENTSTLNLNDSSFIYLI